MPRVPHYSQHLHVRKKYWKTRSCGVVALKMVLDYWQKDQPQTLVPDIDTTIRRGVEMGAYVESVGWNHRGIVELAKSFEFRGKNYDWFSKNPEWAFRKTKYELKTGPVIVSIHKDLDREKSGHLVVVTRITTNRIYYLDPDTHVHNKIRRIASKKRFLGGWKRRIIVIRP